MGVLVFQSLVLATLVSWGTDFLFGILFIMKGFQLNELEIASCKTSIVADTIKLGSSTLETWD